MKGVGVFLFRVAQRVAEELGIYSDITRVTNGSVTELNSNGLKTCIRTAEIRNFLKKHEDIFHFFELEWAYIGDSKIH